MLPIKTTIEDIDALSAYLRTQVGWVPLDRVRKTIESKYADNRKLEAQRRVGLIERDGNNIKLSDRGRAYATAGDQDEKARCLAQGLREVQLYVDTLEWIHHSKIVNPSKTVIGNYWHDKHSQELEGAQGSALTDAVIFFMKVAGAAGLGTFRRGSVGHPDSYLKSDAAAIESFISQSAVPKAEALGEDAHRNEPVLVGVGARGNGATSPRPDSNSGMNSQLASDPRWEAPSTTGSGRIDVRTSPAIHVNLEIHIAANATAETVAEIFKNMRKYVLNNPETDGGE